MFRFAAYTYRDVPLMGFHAKLGDPHFLTNRHVISPGSVGATRTLSVPFPMADKVRVVDPAGLTNRGPSWETRAITH